MWSTAYYVLPVEATFSGRSVACVVSKPASVGIFFDGGEGQGATITGSMNTVLSTPSMRMVTVSEMADCTGKRIVDRASQCFLCLGQLSRLRSPVHKDLLSLLDSL